MGLHTSSVSRTGGCRPEWHVSLRRWWGGGSLGRNTAVRAHAELERSTVDPVHLRHFVASAGDQMLRCRQSPASAIVGGHPLPARTSTVIAGQVLPIRTPALQPVIHCRGAKTHSNVDAVCVLFGCLFIGQLCSTTTSVLGEDGLAHRHDRIDGWHRQHFGAAILARGLPCRK